MNTILGFSARCDQENYEEFLSYIHKKFGYNFSQYSKKSIHRRLNFALNQFRFNSVHSLAQLLSEHPEKIFNLIEYLTIGTTELFRDPQFFFNFRRIIVPILKTYNYPCIWIAGCSTGEEVLSYAIILAEEDLLHRTTIYATDINSQRLKKAKRRIYDINTVKKNLEAYYLSGGRFNLSKYYTVHDNQVIFNKHLFKNINFADHCLVTDFSFSEFHYISCRYVLIYFQDELKLKVLKSISESLSESGILGVGKLENLRFIYRQKYFEVSECL